MSALLKRRRREVAAADVADARLTVRRFLASGHFDGRFESLAGGAAVPELSGDDLRDMAQHIAAAAGADPLAYAVLGARRSENDLKNDLAGAFGALHSRSGAPALSAAEYSSLEAITLLSGRPALLVVDDGFALPEGVWELLAAYRPDLDALLRAVGRLELDPAFGTYAGTAFVVGPGLVMTNRHVVDSLYAVTGHDAQGQPSAWEFYPGVNPAIEFKGEYGRNARSRFMVTGIASIFPEDDGAHDVDLALLRLAPAGTEGQAPPAPVRTQRNAQRVQADAMVCVAGYPDADDGRNDKQEMDRIYGAVYQVKRLSPGKILAVDPDRRSLSHDCTTLGGNSGSCVYDLATNSVVGLHWGGHYLAPNHAVLLPPLYGAAGDPRLAGVNFQED